MRNSLTQRITFSYFLIILLVFLLLGGAFHTLARVHLIRQAEANLMEDIRELAANWGKAEEELGKFPALRVLRLSPGDFILYKSDGSVISTSRDISRNKAKAIWQALPSLAGEEVFKRTLRVNTIPTIVAARSFPVKKLNQNVVLVGFAEVKGIQSLNRGLFVILLGLTVPVGVVALLLSYFMARSITKPLRQLNDVAKKWACRDFYNEVRIGTGDELEELGNSFNRMARQLARHEVRQREFFQNISHELKTPLMAIQGYSEGIRDGILQGGEADNGLQTISLECQRLKDMVNQLIYVSKLESLPDIYNYSDVDLNELARHTLETLGILAQEKGISISYAHGDIPILRLDSDKTTQALLNLVSNALRHARSQVLIMMEKRDNTVVIKVGDDGTGIPPELGENIFHRFVKGDEEGTGLGLAITKAIIEGHGGTISVGRGALGGAEFVVTLPLTGVVKREGVIS